MENLILGHSPLLKVFHDPYARFFDPTKMQKAVLSGEFEDEKEKSCVCGGDCGCHHQEEQHFEMTTSYHYEL